MSGQEDAVDLVRQLQSLKNAFIAERDAREAAQKEISALQSRISVLQNDQFLARSLRTTEAMLAEKEALALRLYKENSQLQDELTTMKEKLDKEVAMVSASSSTGGFFGGSGGKKAQQNERIVTEMTKIQSMYEALHQKYKAVELEVRTKDKELADVREQYSVNLTIAESRIGDLEASLRDALEKLNLVEKENSRAAEVNINLLSEKMKQDLEAKLWKKKADQAKSELQGALDMATEKSEQCIALENELAETRSTMERLASKLMEYKSALAAYKLDLKRYACFRVSEGRYLPAQLLLHKNPKSHVVSLDIEDSEGNLISRPIRDVIDVVKDVNDSGKSIGILMQDSELEVLELDDRDGVVETILEFMKISADQEAEAESEREAGMQVVMDDLSSLIAV